MMLARDKADLTREELGARAQVEPNSIYRYETGKQIPSFATALRIARALKVSVYELVPDDFFEEKKEDAKDRKGAADVFYQLTEEQQDVMLQLMRTMIA